MVWIDAMAMSSAVATQSLTFSGASYMAVMMAGLLIPVFSVLLKNRPTWRRASRPLPMNGAVAAH